MARFYSTIEIKSVDEERREIEGVATTPKTDRAGDIVDPKGARYKLPIPFLWQHSHYDPIGSVVAMERGDGGIAIRAKLVKASDGMPPAMAARLEEAWHSIKSGLVRGLSIGFRAIDREMIEGGGRKFIEYEILEVSAVTIPANSDASIVSVKRHDMQGRAIKLVKPDKKDDKMTFVKFSRRESA